MKRIDEGIYTSAHNLIFVSKGYDYLSLFLKGNKTVLNGGNINKIHIFLDFTTCTFKLFDMLNEIADDKDEYAYYSVSSGCGDAGSNRRLIFDWTDDDLDDEYFYNYDND